MNIRTYLHASCASSAIEDLGAHRDALDAMSYFCKNELGTLGGYIKKYGKLACFYSFVAGPEVPGKGHSKPWVKYGTEFAQFIVDNKLGEIATLGPKKNSKHHSDTTAQVWMWSPNQESIEAWWSETLKGMNNGK